MVQQKRERWEQKMTEGVIHNKEAFLDNVAKKLGRSRRSTGVTRPQWKHQPQREIFNTYSRDDLVNALKMQCENIHTDVIEATIESLPQAIAAVVSNYKAKSVVTWDDPRFAQFGLNTYFDQTIKSGEVDVHVWDPRISKEENVAKAERADVGITFSDITLAESGTVVLFSGNGKGRSVSLLPTTYIAIIPKSTIVPRMTQATSEIHERIERGENVASCVNFISGPSNSADIEMNLVVGVHGPVKATYIIVEDE
jgi:L-lactate dehydrogenase complex protein LldG